MRSQDHLHPSCRPTCALLLIVLVFAGADALAAGQADASRFTYLYQTLTLPRGAHEYEQWVTWQTDKESDPDYHRLEFRQEFEHGISDRMHFAIYLATWRHTRTSEGNKTQINNTAVEVVYTTTDPRESWLGSALYGEVKFDSRKIAVEGKLLL